MLRALSQLLVITGIHSLQAKHHFQEHMFKIHQQATFWNFCTRTHIKMK